VVNDDYTMILSTKPSTCCSAAERQVICDCDCSVDSYFDPEECLYMSTTADNADDTRWSKRQQLMLPPLSQSHETSAWLR